MEFDEFDFDPLDEELAEIDRMAALTNEAFEWWIVLLDLKSLTEQFQNNLRSLKQGAIIPTKELIREDNSFLYGTLLSGVISAYEGFVHDLLDACLRKDAFMDNAIANISKLDPKDQGYLKIKKNGNAKDFKIKLRETTLHDPIKVARIAEALFGLPFPKPSNGLIIKILEIRNAFTHNNGKVKDEKIILTINDFLSALDIFDEIVIAYLNELVNAGNYFMEQNKQV
ncbi:hypothetical protein HG547_04415 [Shewanella sp. DNRA4]|uniref:hypothetical protein n=1 Tax=Shewanella sp. DNRA4 TaxID=2723055 RepID=UPI00146D8045|nr:hypothetical protein [Shewanella sp. DNRA4]NMD50875.1 hypothetical protein [Shewanella sp. DNRA4]